MKTSVKKIMIIALIMFLVIALVTVVNAEGNGSLVSSSFKGNPTPEGSAAITKIISAVLGVVRTAGAAIAIIMLMTIAAKYIMASAGDRADIKKYAVNYVVGAIILFGTTGILGIVQDFVNTSVKYNGSGS